MKRIVSTISIVLVAFLALAMIPENPKAKNPQAMLFDFNNVVDLLYEPENNARYIEYMIDDSEGRKFYDIYVEDSNTWRELNEFIEIFYYNETDVSYFKRNYIVKYNDKKERYELIKHNSYEQFGYTNNSR